MYNNIHIHVCTLMYISVCYSISGRTPPTETSTGGPVGAQTPTRRVAGTPPQSEVVAGKDNTGTPTRADSGTPNRGNVATPTKKTPTGGPPGILTSRDPGTPTGKSTTGGIAASGDPTTPTGGDPGTPKGATSLTPVEENAAGGGGLAGERGGDSSVEEDGASHSEDERAKRDGLGAADDKDQRSPAESMREENLLTQLKGRPSAVAIQLFAISEQYEMR